MPCHARGYRCSQQRVGPPRTGATSGAPHPTIPAGRSAVRRSARRKVSAAASLNHTHDAASGCPVGSNLKYDNVMHEAVDTAAAPAVDL